MALTWSLLRYYRPIRAIFVGEVLVRLTIMAFITAKDAIFDLQRHKNPVSHYIAAFLCKFTNAPAARTLR